jgi:hypothetical protein
MNTGALTPRSNTTIQAMRFSGGFGQPDGFASVLIVRVAESGEVSLTLDYRTHPDTAYHQWSVQLTNEQRVTLANFLLSYKPTLWESLSAP